MSKPEPGTPEFEKLIKSKKNNSKVLGPPSDQYKKNFEAIFGKHEPVEKKSDLPEGQPEEHDSLKPLQFTGESVQIPEYLIDLYEKKADETIKSMEEKLFHDPEKSGSLYGNLPYNPSLTMTNQYYEIIGKSMPMPQSAFPSRQLASTIDVHPPAVTISKPYTQRIGDVELKVELKICWKCLEQKCTARNGTL